MVKRSISTGEARDDLVVSTENPSGATRRRHTSPISIALAISMVVVGGYAAFNRIGTTANADSVEFTQNFAGGFLAVGMTKDQPGFMVLSALDREKVDVNTDQAVNRVTGTHTVVEVQTPHETMRIRLRGPQIVLVSEKGAVERHEVDWTVVEFNALREAADCSHEAAIKKHRCGAPFTELHEALAMWPGERVPERVRTFLATFVDHRTHRKTK